MACWRGVKGEIRKIPSHSIHGCASLSLFLDLKESKSSSHNLDLRGLIQALIV